MNLDVNTLFVVAIYVEALLGLLLLFAWVQNTQIRAVAWWGCAHLMRSGSIALFGMYGSVSDLISIDLDAPNAVPMYDVYSQIVYALKASDVEIMVVGGKVLLKDGKVLTMDEPQAIAKAREYGKKVAASLK